MPTVKYQRKLCLSDAPPSPCLCTPQWILPELWNAGGEETWRLTLPSLFRRHFRFYPALRRPRGASPPASLQRAPSSQLSPLVFFYATGAAPRTSRNGGGEHSRPKQTVTYKLKAFYRQVGYRPPRFDHSQRQYFFFRFLPQSFRRAVLADGPDGTANQRSGAQVPFRSEYLDASICHLARKTSSPTRACSCTLIIHKKRIVASVSISQSRRRIKMSLASCLWLSISPPLPPRWIGIRSRVRGTRLCNDLFIHSIVGQPRREKHSTPPELTRRNNREKLAQNI